MAGPEPVEEPAGEETASAHRRRLARSTALFALATGGSRILGLVREIVVRRYFGVEGSINAFTVAFQVPNLIRMLVADAALSSAFVPVFSELLEKGQRARAWRVASSLFFLLLLALTALTALFVLVAPWVMRPFGYEDDQHDLVVGLSRVLFPIVTLLGVSGVIVGVLNSYERFTVPALTPIFWNLAIIVALVVGVPRADTDSAKLYVYAGGVLAGTVIQVLLPVPWLARLDGSLRVALDWRDPAVRRVLALMLPVSLGLGLINFNLVVDTFFAARFLDPELAPSAIDAAFRIYMLPQGIFSVAIATVLFPSLSRLAARGDADGFLDTVSLGVRQIGFLLVPASAIGAALSVPIVRVLYERGAFGADETTVVGHALAAFLLGLTFNGMMLMLNRAFFSLQQPWVPTWVALGNLFVNAGLDLAFYRLGIWGLPLATAVVNVVAATALFVILRRRLGRLDARAIAASYARVLPAAAAAAGVAWGVYAGLDGPLGRALGAQVVAVGAAVGAATVAYLVLARLLGIREVGALLSLVGRSGRRSGGRPA
ncbi:MAG: murein biosynthesis integral membrane protein MurJ [Thermoleophilia bacterium]|nr:murein biosynthesis integral membrane protein MurJ [Thermoleophilia bacterium]